MLLVMSVQVLALLLSWNGKGYQGKVIAILVANISILYYSYIGGIEGGAQYIYFANILVTFTIFSSDEKKTLIFNLFFIAICYAFLELVIFPNYEPVIKDTSLNLLLRYGYIITTFSVCCIFLTIIYKENFLAEKSLRNKNEELSVLTESLEKTKYNLNKSKNELEEALKIKSKFLSNMSHEMRTPLNIIMGLSQQMKEYKSDKINQEYLDSILGASDGLLRLVNDILDLLKSDQNILTIKNERFSIKKKLLDLEKLALSYGSNKEVKVSFEVDDDLHEWVKSDPDRINQVILNLLTNAIKFSNSGETVVCKVKVLEQNETLQRLKVNIIDTGIGISKDDLGVIFDSFKQVDSDINKKYNGAGLGLSISEKIIELLGGHINVKSELGKGSDFELIIPLQKINEVIVDTKLKKEKGSITNCKVLLVEDNEMNQLVVSQLLKRKNIEFDIANSGEEAMTILENNTYQLILLDLHMPGMSGYELVLKYKESDFFNKDTRIIAVTADAFESTRKKVLDHGIDDLITKPIMKDEFYNKLSTPK